MSDNALNMDVDIDQGIPDDEEVKLMKPLAQIKNFLKQQASDEEQVRIQDMKWVLNDTFLLILTSRDEIVIFDVLL